MTLDEAIKILGECKFCRNAYKGECVSDSGCFEAKTMAIEALKYIDLIKAERDAAVEDLKNVFSPYGNCQLCKHNKDRMSFGCMKRCIRDDLISNEDYKTATDCWEWRGANAKSI